MTEPYKELRWKDAPLYTAGASEAILSEQEDASPTPCIPIHAETTALLVVDVQPEYWSNCPAVRRDFPEFPENMRRTIDICRKRRAKLLWVRADYRYSHSPWLAQFERLRGKSPDFLTEVPCDPTSEEFTWEEFATPEGGEVIIPKTSWSSVSNTALVDHLRGSGIDTVLVCGLITSVCVQHSAFGIFEAGFRTLLVTDACADRGQARHDAALALYGDYMYELVTSGDLETGLIQATPVWLTLDSMRNVISNRLQPLQKLQGGNESELAQSPEELVSNTDIPAITVVTEQNGQEFGRLKGEDDTVPLSMASSMSSLCDLAQN